MGQIMVRLIRTGSELQRMEGRRVGKKGVQYLLGSRCLLASPGSACSSVTETERQARAGHIIGGKDKDKEENKRQINQLE